jgi:hypothetical protein
MINRWIGIATLGLMLSVNAALIMRDILPDWLAGDPPQSRALHLSPGDLTEVQLGMFDREGRRIGYSWTRSNRSGDLVTVRNQTVLRALELPRHVTIPALRIDTELNYHGQTSLDQLRVSVSGLGMPVRLDGEFIPPNDFPCEWQVGARRGNFVLSADATRAVGDMIRPFESLTGLVVGQSWRVKLVNPLAGIIPGWGSGNMLTDTMLVRVTAVERIEHDGQAIEAFVLEAEKLRAWVTPAGHVVRQEIELPLFGVLTLTEEPYDDEARQQSLHRPLIGATESE